MNESSLPDEFVRSLLAQDSFFGSEEFNQHRREVVVRLARAGTREQRARKLVFMVAAVCFVIFVTLFAEIAHQIRNQAAEPPEWLQESLVMVILLLPLTVLVFLGLYFIRYRLELVHARKQARQEALLELPRQLTELRKELELLRKELKTPKQTESGEISID